MRIRQVGPAQQRREAVISATRLPAVLDSALPEFSVLSSSDTPRTAGMNPVAGQSHTVFAVNGYEMRHFFSERRSGIVRPWSGRDNIGMRLDILYNAA